MANSLSVLALDDSEFMFEFSGIVNTLSVLGALTMPDLLLGDSDALRNTSAAFAIEGGVSEAALGLMNKGGVATGCLSPSSSLTEGLRTRSSSVSLVEVL